jgi:hypothetical protein
MNLCSDSHEEICFEGRMCPLCDIIECKKAIEKELEIKSESLDTAQEKVEELLSKIDDMAAAVEGANLQPLTHAAENGEAPLPAGA